MDRWLNSTHVRLIPRKHLPLLVLTDGLRSWVASRIKSHTEGFYNHMVWMHEPGMVASQDVTFREYSIERYFPTHRMKFWHNPNWTDTQRYILSSAIKQSLRRPWHERLYDPLDILGKALTTYTRIPFNWLHIPGFFRICSEHSFYLRRVDPSFKLNRPAPADVNRWMMGNEDYQVYGRYTPD